MSYWVDDPQLFLYAKGTGPDDVILRRCKKPMSSSSSSLVVPMKSDDFEYVSNVKNYVDLIKDEFDWDETDYKRLVKYIYERLLLVNRQGLVIAEIYKLDDAKLVVPIYIRSLDVLPLKPYIPNIRERRIPLRTVKYLEDANGEAAMMEEMDSNEITKLTARVENLEAENTRLESKNNTLDTSVTQLTAENKTLDSNVKTLEDKVTNLRADLVTQMNALTTLQQEVKNNHQFNPNIKEVWLNDLTNSDWVGVEGLIGYPQQDVVIIGSLGTFTVNDSSTNVRARYWYKIKIYGGERKAVCLEDLTYNKEMAKFSPKYPWHYVKGTDGKTYVYSLI